MKIDVLIQARMTSTRLPEKTMMDAAGEPILYRMIERVRRLEGISDVIVATTTNKEDDCIVAMCEEKGVPYFRGSEDDVLGRILNCAKEFKTDVIVQITGDDCLSSPEIGNEVISAYKKFAGEVDYVANDFVPGYSYGFGVKAYATELIQKVADSTSHPTDREHVVNYIEEHPQEFRILSIPVIDKSYVRPDIRLTLDTQDDYDVMRQVFENLYPKNKEFTAKDIIKFLDDNPEIRDLNSEVVQATYVYE